MRYDVIPSDDDVIAPVAVIVAVVSLRLVAEYSGVAAAVYGGGASPIDRNIALLMSVWRLAPPPPPPPLRDSS